MIKNGVRISVISPSIRPQYLNITQECLERQTFQDFEWLVDIDLRNNGYQLPKALNRLLKRSKGEIIVMLQDCITVDDNFLQHVVDTYTGDFVTYPLGKKNGDNIDWDWRKGNNNIIQPQEWEADLAVAPRKAFFDIGGYDETYCDGWSWENVEVAYRAKAAGYNFICDNRVSGVAIDHDKEVENPFRNKKPNNDWRARNTQVLCATGDFKLPYLYEDLIMNDGEIADRYSILLLKKERLQDENIMGEFKVFHELVLAKPHLHEGVQELYKENGLIWDLESDIRRGKEAELGLEEVGRRAIQIRDHNKNRIAIKNKINVNWFKEVKVNHASQ